MEFIKESLDKLIRGAADSLDAYLLKVCRDESIDLLHYSRCSLIAHWECRLFLYIMYAKNGGAVYERKENPFISG